MRYWRLLIRLGAVIATVGIVATACQSESGSDAEQSQGAGADPTATATSSTSGDHTYETGLVGDQQAGEPVDGGTLSFAVYGEASTLDPLHVLGAGTAGGSEAAAIYGVLLRFNPETAEYEPQMAASLDHNDDYTRWTVGLRPDVHFTDGTVLDAQALKFNTKRILNESGKWTDLLTRFLSSVETPDDLTVVYNLSTPWANFPYVLSQGPGFIASPTAVRKWGEDFGAHPVGAGPFMLERLAPGEELVLTANPDYWDGRPHLDALRFVPIPGARTKLDTLDTGGIDAAFLRNSQVIVEAREAAYPGFLNVASLGGILLTNNREGMPASDIRVRKAIAYAVDTDIINERAFDGLGITGKDVFLPVSRWHTDVDSLPYDPAKAKSLLNEATQDGYDGQIALTYPKSSEDVALATQAMLNAAGFTTSLDPLRTIGELIQKVVIDRDYELSTLGHNTSDAAPYIPLYKKLVNDDNYMGYHNEKMTSLIKKFRSTSGYDARLEVMADIQRHWNETMPFIPINATPQFIAWQQDIHGVKPTAHMMVLFDDAWISGS